MFIKKIVLTLAAAAVCFVLGSGIASAQVTNSDSATVTYSVSSVTQLELTGNVSLTVVAKSGAGSGLESDTDATAVTYAITNNAGSKKIQGSLNSAMPSGTTLTVNVAPPAGGAESVPNVVLTAAEQDLVTGIGDVTESGIAISFTLAAEVTADVVANATKTFTMTVIGS